MRRVRLSLAVLVCIVAIALPRVSWAQSGPPALLTIIANPATRPVLVLEPGFNLFLVFDAAIDFVAVGDEQLLAVSARGQEGVIGLRPLSPTGRTNLHVQAGGVLVVFEVRIMKGQRTADVVRVLTQPATAMKPQPQQSAGAAGQARPEQSAQKATEGQDNRTGPVSRRQSPPQPNNVEFIPNPVGFLTEEGLFRLQEVSERGVKGAFQAYRTPSGLEVRYQIMNTSGYPWKVVASRILVRADGRIVPVRILRNAPSPDGQALPHGAIETGVIVLLSGARNVELTFPLFPEVLDPKALPVVFTVRFTDLQGLPEVRLR